MTLIACSERCARCTVPCPDTRPARAPQRTGSWLERAWLMNPLYALLWFLFA